jgi:hypothetical protein
MRINIEHRLRIYKPRFISKLWFSDLVKVVPTIWWTPRHENVGWVVKGYDQ